MSLLEGFDVVIELDRSTLSALLADNPLAASFQPPFERTFDVPGGTPTAPVRAHFVFTRREVFLHAPSTVELRLTFERSSVIGHPDFRRTLGGADLTRLRGTASVHVPISLQPGRDPASRELVLDLRGCTASVQFERPRADAPDGTNGALLLVRGAMIDVIQRELHAMAGTAVVPNNPHIALPLRVDPGAAPSLNPLVIADARLVIFAPEDPARQSLAIFGTLLGTTPGSVTRTESAVVPGSNFTFAVSPRAFHRIVFGPALQRTFLIARPEMMPPTIGEAESVPYPDLPHWSITHVEDTLNEGAVDLHLQARYVSVEGAFGSEQHVDIRGNITFDVVHGRIVPGWHTDGIAGWIEYAWGWWLSAAFGPGVTMAIAEAIVGGAAASSGSAFVPALTGVDLPPLGLPGAQITGVQVHPHDFAISGTVPAVAPGFFQFRTAIGTAVDQLKEAAVPGGVFTSTGCPEGDFTWAGTHRVQRFTFTPRAAFGSEPVQFAWRISGFNFYPRAPVDLGSSFLRIAAETSYPDPPPGHLEVRRDIEIACEVTADGRMIITCGPDDGNYRLDVECTASDAEGNRSVALGYVMVETRRVTFEAPWQARMAECARLLGDAAGRAGYGHHEQGRPGGLDDKQLAITPSELTAFVLGATLSGKPDTLRNIMMTYGPRLSRGFSADANPTTPELALRALQDQFKEK
jgi:hypothetical protein